MVDVDGGQRILFVAAELDVLVEAGLGHDLGNFPLARAAAESGRACEEESKILSQEHWE